MKDLAIKTINLYRNEILELKEYQGSLQDTLISYRNVEKITSYIDELIQFINEDIEDIIETYDLLEGEY